MLPKLTLAPVDIHINGNDFSSGKPIEFNPSDIETSRYYSYLDLLLVKDLDAKTESVLLIERLGASPQPEKSNWRFFWISKDGKVKEELFNNKERKQQSSRTYLINKSATAGNHLEYKTRVLGGFPTYLYPIGYPWLSFLAGAVLAAYGLTRLAKKGQVM
ncbi:hypothetical protein [Mesobacillus zeae]|uniref:Uncharacterized protein n=1 Tax=Mesobacillus zeae TaxID=1917180 RepID=A0A398B1C6_9BACI|nr:hypothetical protein [Mesobacillus zeae]RID82698.1 hypothetical protein D1970_18375 [Mesobacillus zeae]